MPVFLYILQSESSGRYYVGQTESILDRLNASPSSCHLITLFQLID